jgi:LysM repeat protein
MMDGSWMFDVRRLAEVEAGLEVFWGMMYNKYIDQTDAAGNVQKIRYSDAFELDKDGIIKLKDGINLEWGMHSTNHIFQPGDSLDSIAKKFNVSIEDIKKKNEIEDESEVKEGDELIISDNTLFNDFKLKVQGVGKKLNGLLDELDTPQANKYLGWRMFSFYRLFALPMFLNRFQMDTSKQNFGGDTYDFNLGTLTKGYYIAGLQYMYKTLKSRGKYLAMATPEEKASLRKMLSEGVMLAMLGLSVGLIFGYDEDDEDRFEKLRKRQKEWGALGYMSNHLLLQILAVKSENELFVPFVGFDDFANLLDQTSLATGPVIGNSIKILQDLYMIATGDDGAIYKQDVGPYWWQEEGDYKLWNHIGGVFGVKGKNYDPVYALKSRETFQNLN